jgi:HprK-related kinase A
VKIGDLMPDQLHRRFAGPGLRARIGPFVFHLHSPLPQFVADFSIAYADFPLCVKNEISDFRIRVTPAFRRWPWREAQAEFGADGASPFFTFPRRLAMPFAEWGLNWCICSHAHQFLMFHSAVVEKAGRAAILAGPPGSGKSTLCAALLGRGWRLLSDELALLDPAQGCLLPIPRPVALKGASIGLIQGLVPRLQIGRAFAPTHKGTLAHLLPPAEAVERQAEPALPGWVVFPTHAENADTRLVPLRKAAAFLRLEKNCFNYDALGLPAFDALSRLIEAAECYELPFAQAAGAAELVDGITELQHVAGVAGLPLDAA